MLQRRYSPEVPPTKMTSYTRFGAFLPDVTGFDAAAFRVARGEAAGTDPQHRLLQEATASALADAAADGSTQTTGTIR